MEACRLRTSTLSVATKESWNTSLAKRWNVLCPRSTASSTVATSYASHQTKKADAVNETAAANEAVAMAAAAVAAAAATVAVAEGIDTAATVMAEVTAMVEVTDTEVTVAETATEAEAAMVVTGAVIEVATGMVEEVVVIDTAEETGAEIDMAAGTAVGNDTAAGTESATELMTIAHGLALLHAEHWQVLTLGCRGVGPTKLHMLCKNPLL